MNGRNQHLVDAAHAWLAAGYHPIPLVGKDGKAPARGGMTGYGGVDLQPDEFTHEFRAPPVVALGIRMPEGVLGIDQDGYDGRQGPEALAELGEELGVALPDAPMISGRLDGRSGIRFYRVPPGLRWSASAIDSHGGGVELIHRGWRHAKAWPSVHHRTGLVLGRLDLEPGALVQVDDGGEPWLLPAPDELPDLPPEWVQALTSRPDTGKRDAIAWVNERGQDAPSASVRRAMEVWYGRGAGSRYGAMVRTQAALVRLDSLGQAGATAALLTLHAEYVAQVGGERDAEGDWGRALNGALERVATTESYGDGGRRLVREVFRSQFEASQRTLSTGVVVHITTNLPDGFWTARPALEHIRRAAWARMRSPDAVFGAVLARLSAITPPLYRVPAIVGAPATLSTYVALVGPSGTGKTTSADLARELLPIPMADLDDVVEHSLGSGEGLIELFMGDIDTGEVNKAGNPIKERGQVRRGAVVVLDEGQALAQMGGRNGNTMLPTVRSMWSGGPVGQANAQQVNTRKLGAGKYALGFIIGLQPALAADLLSDTAAGTPQRFLWLSTTDPSIPEVGPPWPGPLAHRTPPRAPDGRAVPELAIASGIVDAVRAAALDVVRGTRAPDPLDSHRDLLRLKVAGLLAILERRLCVTDEDWELAGVVVDTSTAVRESTQQVLSLEAMRREDEADRKAAKRAKVVKAAEAEQQDAEYLKALEVAARSVAKRAARVGVVDERAARHAIAGKYRKVLGPVGEVLTHGVAMGWLVEVDGGWSAGKVEP